MGRVVLRGALAVVAAFAAADARAAGEAPDTPIADVDALVALLSLGADDPAETGPSPTARVARLVAAGEPRVRPLLAEAWRIAATVPAAADRREGVRRLVRFLFETGLPDAPGPWLVETDGVVRVRHLTGDGAEATEPPAARGTDEVPVPFEQAVKGAHLRAAPRPDAKRLLASLDGGAVAADERDAAAQALGELCASGTALVRELQRRAETEGSEPWTA